MSGRNRRGKELKMIGKFAIQKYWLDIVSLEDVLKAYGLTMGSPHRSIVVKILQKTKRDFIHGWSFFTREDIDLKIRKILG